MKMMFMKNYSKNSIILTKYPFTDLTRMKVRPAIIISENSKSNDVFIVPLTSISKLKYTGEFLLEDWDSEGLNRPTFVKRGIFTISKNIIIKTVGDLSSNDKISLQTSLKLWIGLN